MSDEVTPGQQAFERMTEAMEAFSVVAREILVPVWNDLREAIFQLWLALARAYLADRWRLGRLAWHLPDWIVRRVPVGWVGKWLEEQVGNDEVKM